MEDPESMEIKTSTRSEAEILTGSGGALKGGCLFLTSVMVGSFYPGPYNDFARSCKILIENLEIFWRFPQDPNVPDHFI